MTDKEKEQLTNSAGTTLAGIGAASYLGGHLGKLTGEGKILKDLTSSRKLRQMAKKNPEEFANAVRSMKALGGVGIGVGGGLLGYSAYKHYKNKKKEKENDNKKTKD